jgi:hypothetical protein
MMNRTHTSTQINEAICGTQEDPGVPEGAAPVSQIVG